MTQPFRTAEGGRIDRSKPLQFTFDGETYEGFEGDSLASALLANGVRLVGRSFKYHRPRGIFTAGAEEPNALIQVNTGARTEPNLRAPQIELTDGMAAASQNRWPSLKFDVGAVNNWYAKLIPSGFYYKTFKWPLKLWLFYEHFIRNAAGLGRAPETADPDTYAHRYAHCDVLVAGGGPAGLMAALAAGRAGARVLIAEADGEFGGALLGRRDTIDGKSAIDWVNSAVAELTALPNVTVLPRTTVSAYYDHNMLLLTERITDHLALAPADVPRQRLWQVRAGEVILATGSIERPLVFADNDRPGVMLASAAQTYANRYGVRAGTRAIVFTNNDTAYTAALDMALAGIDIMAVVDPRPEVSADIAERMKSASIGILAGHVVAAAHGKTAVHGATVMSVEGGDAQEIQCDLLCVSGGWTPTVHLFSQSRGKLRYDETLTAFVPNESFQRERSAGACNGAFELAECLRQGAEAGAAAADAEVPKVPAASPDQAVAPLALWAVPFAPGHHGKRFVDHQNDVTAEDVSLAHREGYSSVEHLKRYTTLGMGTDQGRTSNVNGLAIMAALRGEEIPAVGTTTFRPPYTPITMGTVTGPEVGHHFAPVRRSPMHGWHEAAGAEFVPAGLWMRPSTYIRPGESETAAIQREARHVREAVGIVDVSTLGKIDIQGRDAAEFLNRVYINGFKKLPVGRVRYGVMLREDGMVFDDGTTTHIAENRYLMTTTTGNAGPVMRHLEYYAQVVWPELDVHLLSVSDDWAGIAIAGPNSRKVLDAVARDIDVSDNGCPFMAYREGTICGAPARLFRISFSGELAYEIMVPADYGLAVWKGLLAAGEAHGIIPYGTEAMGVLRIEKGHVVGGELNGRMTADDLGFGAMMSADGDVIGRRGQNRPGLNDDKRKHLVGLVPTDRATPVPRGAQLVADPDALTPVDMQGEVTSNCVSPNLGHPIALGLLRQGRGRHGETLYAHSPLTGVTVPVTVTDPVFIDPEGERLRG